MIFSPLISGFTLTNIKVIVQRSLHVNDLLPYPDLTMPFFVYGTEHQRHIDHVYTAYPNIQLSADQVNIAGLTPPAEEDFVYGHLQLPERAMQPFDANSLNPSFFRPEITFTNVKFTRDFDGHEVVGTGSISLTANIFTDIQFLNGDPVPEEHDHHKRLDALSSDNADANVPTFGSYPVNEADERKKRYQALTSFVVRDMIFILFFGRFTTSSFL